MRHWITTTLAAGLCCGAASGFGGPIQINEIRLDQPGTDNDEYLELAGPASTSLDGLTLIVIGDGGGGSGTIENVTSLDGLSVGPDGLFLMTEATFSFGGTPDLVTNLNFENSDNVTYLLVEGFTGMDGDDLDTDDDGVLDAEPWTAIVDAVGLLEEPNPPLATEFAYGESLGFEDVGPDGAFVPAHVYRCSMGGLWLIGEFDPTDENAVDSPDAVNPECPQIVLSVSKDGPAVVISGNQVTYTISVRNEGVDDAVDVTITDFLPKGMTFVSESSPPEVVLVDDMGPEIGWEIDTVGLGDEFVIELVVAIDPVASGQLENVVEVATSSMGDDPKDNVDSVVTTASPIVDPPTGVQINEVRIEQAGPDTDEYFELAGPPSTSLDGLAYIVIGDGDPELGSGVVEFAVGLTGFTIDASGFFVAADETFTVIPPFLVDLLTDLQFEGSDNVTHLLVANFAGATGDDLDTDDDGILDVTPWSDLLDAIGFLEEPNPPTNTEFAYGASLGFVDAGPDGPFVPGHLFRCFPDGIWRIGTFDLADENAADTPGEVNPDCPPVMLTVTKDGPAKAIVGGEITYTLTVSNSGADPAAEVTVTDTLPAGLTFVSENSPAEVVLQNVSEPTITWTIESVAGKRSFVIELVAMIGEEVQPGEIINTVDVTTTSGGDDPGDNSDTAATQVAGIIDPPDNLILNEIRVDRDGNPDDEYAELRGDPDTALDGLTYLVIGDGPGGSGVIEAVVDLGGQTIPGDGLFVIAEDTFSLGTADLVTDLAFENSDNVTHLLVANFGGELGQDLDTDDDGNLDVTPWSDVLDAVGFVEEPNPPAGTEFSYGAALGFEDVGPLVDGKDMFAPAHLYRCQPDGTWTIGRFDLDADDDGVVDDDIPDTPGAPNAECVAPSCPADTDGNGFVDVDDLVAVIIGWGTDGSANNSDVNDDGIVNVDDLVAVILAWGICD